MKFRKNWKQFWTLDRHHAEGFTLVELIVVIAILAILGGVAVPAYGGYVKKANMTADQTLISEVANALTLQYYSNAAAINEKGGAYVILYTNENQAEADVIGTEAMISAFGQTWGATTLKYDWTADGSFASGMAGGTSFLNSPYADTNAMMAQISGLTDAVVGKLDGKDNVNQYLSTVIDQAQLEKVAAATGVDLNKANNQQLANLVVLAAATEVCDSTDSNQSQVSSLVGKYATYTAIANATPEQKEVIFGGDPAKEQAFMSDYNNLVTSGNPSTNFQNFDTNYDAELFNYSTILDENGKGIAENNEAAFKAAMQAIADASGEFTADELGTDGFYGSDSVISKVGAFKAGATLADLGLASVPANAVVVFLTLDANGIPVVQCSSAEALLK